MALACMFTRDPLILNMLVSGGASMKDDHMSRMTVFFACACGQPALVDALMKYDPTMYEKTAHPGGLLAFEEAAMAGKPEMVQVCNGRKTRFEGPDI